jgi:LmbE family N-acetylglucosaminyl deacetylase
MKVSIHNKAATYDAVFLSPHLDDAVLSAGLKIAALIQQKKSVLIVTFFTRGDVPRSPDAHSFLEAGGYADCDALFLQRCREDAAAANILKCDILHLDFCDALYRSSNSNGSPVPLYSSFQKLFSGKMHPADRQLQGALTKVVQVIYGTFGHAKTTWYAPLGVGQHIDHLLIRNATVEADVDTKVQFWEDVPYQAEQARIMTTLASLQSFQPVLHETVYLRQFGLLKKKAVKAYTSQLTAITAAGVSTTIYAYERYYHLYNPVLL